jgi:hypothetical protein
MLHWSAVTARATKLLEARADLKTAAAMREQLEERLRAAERVATERASVAAATSKQAHPSKPSRRPTNRRRSRASELIAAVAAPSTASPEA